MVTVAVILKAKENLAQLTGVQALDPEEEEVHIFWRWSEGYAFSVEVPSVHHVVYFGH